MNTQPDTPPSRSKHLWFLAIPLTVIGGAMAFLFWFFGRPVPEAASLDAAAAVTLSTVAGETSSDSSTTSVATDGTWVINTAIGEFSFDDATSTFAGFRVNEVLSGIGSAVAVGRTPAVSGSLMIEQGVVTAASIEVDLTSIVSNQSRRDSRIQQALNTTQHPLARFVLDEPIEIGRDLGEGNTFSADATGQLTINGITSSVTISLEGTSVEGSVLLAGGIDIRFADFSVAVPSAPIVLSGRGPRDP